MSEHGYIIERETPEQKAFKRGKIFAAKRDQGMGRHVERAGLSAIHAYLYKGDQPRVVAIIKQDLDWAEFNFWDSLTGIPNIELAQFWLVEMKECIDSLAALCNIPDLILDETIGAYDAILQGSSTPGDELV